MHALSIRRYDVRTGYAFQVTAVHHSLTGPRVHLHCRNGKIMGADSYMGEYLGAEAARDLAGMLEDSEIEHALDRETGIGWTVRANSPESLMVSGGGLSGDLTREVALQVAGALVKAAILCEEVSVREELAVA
jgi:hypothetical protein